jgi:uncharacterized membrane protein YcaP (DUF421 family)
MPEWITILMRSLFLFIFIVIALRIAGRKQTSQMTYSDFVIGIVVGGIVALISLNIITNLAYGMIGLGIWILLPMLTNYLSLKSKWFHDLFRGRETVMIKHGKVMEDNLKEVRFTGEELLSQLRRKNIFNVADVEFAVLEANGEITALLKSEKTPITPKHLQWQVAARAEPQTVILDGNIINEGLRTQGVDRAWLKVQLDKMGISPENVFIGQVDSSGDLYVDLFDDAILIPQPTTKDLLYATLKSCEADLEIYALSTQNPQTKAMYGRCANELAEMITELKIQLKR